MTKRCKAEGCKKKLSLVHLTLTCKCGKCFCDIHRFPESHNCTFDYNSKELMDKKLDEMKCVADKVIKV